MTHISVGKYAAEVIDCTTAIVGTGAAGYNAADRLWDLGHRNILLLSENRCSGTSRNTGSDKQTYYKLSLAGDKPDSVRHMAQTLFDGQCVDGDLALCEAALSARCFLKLAELGVSFPKNRYGEYVGYQTDHDPYGRATSMGPYTSRAMTERLEAQVMAKKIPMLDHAQVIKIISDGKQVYGLLCYRPEKADPYCFIRCRNVVYATGGPAGMYADSVYPQSQHGATGLALEAGAVGKNLTEWQYGLASVQPRWNVSGTYMQVLPRVFSSKADGSDEREFLMDFFQSPEEMMSKLFLKGYQWPFDVRKVENGSSVIDILVYLETQKGRRVFLDYRQNAGNMDIPFEKLSEEAYTYLKKAGACFGTPFERLAHMNLPAVQFYRDRKVELETEPLEIALCAQHNNGGLGIDCWWQTNVEGLFAVGEAAASHGVYRPGGTALNAGQVGSTRAAEFIANSCELAPREGFETLAQAALQEMTAFAEAIQADSGNIPEKTAMFQSKMSSCGSSFRSQKQIEAYYSSICKTDLSAILRAKTTRDLAMAYRLRDMLLSQKAYLFAMLDYMAHGGKSRGSALYTDPRGKKPYAVLPEMFTFTLDTGENAAQIQEVCMEKGRLSSRWRTVRPIPEMDDCFETVWRQYRNKEIFLSASGRK